MNEGLIPRRYAKALYKFSAPRREEKRVYELMHALSHSFSINTQLHVVMQNPFINDDDKVKLLMTAASAIDKDACFCDFLKLLVQNQRLSEIRDIALAYIALYRQSNNIYPVEVVSAAPMGDKEETRLKQLIEKHLGGGVMEYSHRIDPELIGGFMVNVGSERLDATIKNELKNLRLKLLSK